MTQFPALMAVLLLFLACAQASEMERQVTIAFGSFKYAEALLELTNASLRHSHSDIPVLLLGSFKEISEAAAVSVLDSIKEAKEAGDGGRSLDVGLILSKRWLKGQEVHADWAQIIHDIRKEFKKLAGFSLRAIMIEGRRVPVGLVHAIEGAKLAVLKSADMKKLNFKSVSKKRARSKLLKKVKKAIKKKRTSSQLLQINFKTHPTAHHLRIIKKAFKSSGRQLVDISTCLLVHPQRPELSFKPEQRRLASNY
jgi:hypothetical protein